MKKLLVLLAMVVVLLNGCDWEKSQYIVVKEKKAMRPFAKILHSISFQRQQVVSRVEYFVRYGNEDFSKLPPEMIKLNNCTVVNEDNWQGDLDLLHIKMVKGKFVEPPVVSYFKISSVTQTREIPDVMSVSFIAWYLMFGMAA